MDAYWLLTISGKYYLHIFSKEEELEKEIVRFSREIFGENTIYISTKKKLTAKELGVSSVPDCFLLDLSNPDDVAFYMVEIELSSHDPKEIAKRILTFEITYDTAESKGKVYDLLIEQIQNGKERLKIVNEVLKKSTVYKDLSTLIYDVVFKQDHQYLIIIDKATETLRKALDVLDVDFEIFEFVTFTNQKGDKAYVFPDFREEAAHPPEENETWYQFYFDDVEELNIDKETFFKEKNIGLFQAFVYTKDKEGKIDGIVFQGYRSRLDRDLRGRKNENEFRWGTRRPVKLDNLRVGMWVYVVETDYDRDAGERIVNPELRVRGKLREVFKVKGKEMEKIFPAS
jgi:hypothetical protein